MLGASIILATYCPNQTRYEFCKQSFAEINNTGISRKDYELIVIDNGGLHQDLIDDLDTDVVITNSRNIGQGAALNEGIAIARSNNLVLMDDDLSYKEGWLRTGLDLLKQYPAYVISLQEAIKEYVTGETPEGHRFSRKVGGIWIMRRSLFNGVGRFGLIYYSFGGLWTRNLIRSGSRFVVNKEPYIFHLGKGTSIIGRKRNKICEYRSRL